MSIYHDISTQTHRSPLGALKCGETAVISLHAPEANARGGELIISSSFYNERYPLRRDGDMLYAELRAPQETGVLWYHFLLHGFPDDFFCGASEDGLSSVIENYWPRNFQLTVYDKCFEVPEWFGRSVMYQIFPDRFARDSSDTARLGMEYHKSLGRKLRRHGSWHEPVCWEPEPGEQSYIPNDFYGGTLKGIEQRLPYLKSLGVGVIYLNPIFEADSNHGYNISDYRKIDPAVGTEEDFERLCREAEALGIRIILDGVFSHTGSDSIYFNREGRYPNPGAYQGEHSPYYEWFDFHSFPDGYRSWWGFPTLPEVNESVRSWQDFIYREKDSVVRHWINKGAGGWRIDVADELPDEVLAGIYEAAKRERPDSVIIGEVWEDPTTKESYGRKRHYALGGMLDSVMNYPLRAAIIEFAGGGAAKKLCSLLLRQRLCYPQPMYNALMNLLSSHDVPRLRTALVADVDALHGDRRAQAEHRLSGEENDRSRALQRLCAAIQFALPGVPCIYYGDEQGMQGAFDPFDRAPFVATEPELAAFYAGLAAYRNGSEPLLSGGVGFCALSDGVLGIVRVAGNEAVLTAVNRGDAEFETELELPGAFRGLTSAERALLRDKRTRLRIEPMDWVRIEL